jgi:uncharacterized protein YgiB involved in biofilm formation
MKSPQTLKLTLMMGAAATLTACGDTPPEGTTRAFTSVVECQQAGFPEDHCQAAYNEAFATHSREAPKFPSKDECERSVDVDQCVSTRVVRDDGTIGDVFVPLMAGYVAGNLMANRPREQQQGTSGGGGGGAGRLAYQAGPIYRSRTYPSGYRDSADLARSRSGASLPSITSGGPGRSLSVPSRSPNVSTTTIARQGFGSSSFSFGGGSS